MAKHDEARHGTGNGYASRLVTFIPSSYVFFFKKSKTANLNPTEDRDIHIRKRKKVTRRLIFIFIFLFFSKILIFMCLFLFYSYHKITNKQTSKQAKRGYLFCTCVYKGNKKMSNKIQTKL